MTRSTMALVAAVIVVAGLSASQVLPRRGSKPVRESVVFVDTAPPPEDAAALAKESEAVVVAKYTGRRRVIEASTTAPMETVYLLDIQEVLKYDPVLPHDEIEVTLTGGERELPTHFERVNIAGADHLKVGHTYVVFLKLNHVTGKLYLAYASSGVYDITSGRVAATKHSRTKDNARRVDAFIAELRATINK